MDAVGLDSYNQMLTGGVAMTLTAKRSDFHHVPCVVVINDGEDERSDSEN